VLDNNIVPIVAFLVAENDEVSGHRRFRVRSCEAFAQCCSLPKSSLGEMNVIDVAGSGWLLTRLCDGAKGDKQNEG
jgi:hypothetical protein